jgi:transposase
MPRVDPRRLVFVDETWASTNMARRTGRSPRGRPLVCPVPFAHWKRTTFVAGLRVGGLVAPMTLDGAMTGDRFVDYLTRVLGPTLRPGDVVVVDNLACHKRVGARQAVEARGATLVFLPPYSPDLSPVELAFSKLKRALRAAGKRTVPELWTFLDAAARLFTPAECAGYFRHDGYPADPPLRGT